MSRPVLRRVLWIGGLVAALAALRATATGDLSNPPLTSPGRLGTWADDRGPVASAMGLVRLAAEVAVWYLLALTALHAVAALTRLRGAGALAAALATPAVTRLVRAGVGVGFVASSTVAGASPPPVPDRAAAATGTAKMRPLPEEPTEGTARMAPLTGGAVAGDAVPATEPAAPAPPPEPPPPATHRVERGESLWLIAEETLAAAWGRAPTDAETDPYWRALVAANRDRLAGDDPDLVFAGQVFELPPVPPPPG